MNFLKQITPTHIIIFLAILWAFTLTIIIGIAITKSSQNDTIVVDASQFINQELKASQERISELDSQYKILFQNLVQLDQERQELKTQIQQRNLTIDLLKKKVNEKDTIPNLSDMQHDSLFSKFLEGFN